MVKFFNADLHVLHVDYKQRNFNPGVPEQTLNLDMLLTGLNPTYDFIENKDVNPTYKQLKAFYKKHKSEKKYENKFSSRDLRYATLKVASSASDSAALKADLTKLKEKFRATNNDSNFVIINSEIPLFVSQIGYKPLGDKTAKEN